MAQFPILRLTHAGQEMAGMSQGGGKLTFVRVELGDGQLKEEDSIEALTDLKRSVMQLPLQGYLNEGNGKARLRFVIDNSALTVGFHNREVGIFAKIDNGAERLYAYTNAGNYADWIPSKETPIDGDIVDLHIVIGNAANVTIQTVSGAYATKIEIEEHRTAAELDHPDKSVHKKHLHQDAYESPALTGIPTAPTANKGTSNQQIANTAFVANGLADKLDKTGGVINPVSRDGSEGYTEGVRMATAPNGWALLILGCKPNTREGNQTKTGGWGFFRTPANELIIGNRDRMADSAAVVFGADQKAYFKQMVYAPAFFAYTRCYAQDAFVTTGDGGLYLQKWGGGWYMNEGTWMRAYGNKNVYTGGAMKADGGFEGNLRGRADSAGNSDSLGGQSLQWLFDQINAAKTGIVASNLAENGWCKFANGLILQWGISAEAYDGYVTFPVSYPQRCFCVQVSSRWLIGGNPYQNFSLPYDIRASGFSFRVDNVKNQVLWIAIGI